MIVVLFDVIRRLKNVRLGGFYYNIIFTLVCVMGATGLFCQNKYGSSKNLCKWKI